MGLTIHYSLRSRARKPERVREQLAGLRSRALDLPFKEVGELVEITGPACDFEQYDREHPHRWLLIQASQYVSHPRHKEYSYPVAPTHIIAFSTWPGEGCEPANFGLCRYPATIEIHDPVGSGCDYTHGRQRKIRTGLAGWRWGSFCKTQYASNAEYGGVPHFLRCHLAVVKLLDRAKELGILERVSDEGDYWRDRNVEVLARCVGEWNSMLAGWAGQLKDALEDQGEGLSLQAGILEYPNFEHLEAAGQEGITP
jgi:hypothetical protein